MQYVSSKRHVREIPREKTGRQHDHGDRDVATSQGTTLLAATRNWERDMEWVMSLEPLRQCSLAGVLSLDCWALGL